jgi:general secretion pathway protein G
VPSDPLTPNLKPPSHIMKTNGNARGGSAAFTLIELMAVITIIALLAAIVIGGTGYATEKQAKSKAKVQIEMLSRALEEYKLDNGAYPATGNTTTGLDNSKLLFDALYFKGASDNTKSTRIYIGELNPTNSKQGWTSGTASASTKIIDPWNNEYRYRTATNASGAANAATQNPDFDLWAVGKDAKTNADPKHKDCRDDIKNF